MVNFKNKIFQKLPFIIIAFLLTFVPFARLVLAQDDGDGSNDGDGDGSNTDNGSGNNLNLNFNLENPLDGSGVNTIPDFIAKVLDILLTIGIPVVAFFIIYAGFLFVTARGSEEQLKTAKATLLWTVVGAAILLGSWVLAQALGATINELK